MGEAVGDLVSLSIARLADGDAVGKADGRNVGLMVGGVDGRNVGRMVGDAVGLAVSGVTSPIKASTRLERSPVGALVGDNVVTTDSSTPWVGSTSKSSPVSQSISMAVDTDPNRPISNSGVLLSNRLSSCFLIAS